VLHALLGKELYFHLGSATGLSRPAIVREAVLDVVALAGLGAALWALRRGAAAGGGPPRRPPTARGAARGVTCAVAALALLAPFVADLAVIPLDAALRTGRERQVAFHAMTAALVAGALAGGARAHARLRAASAAGAVPGDAPHRTRHAAAAPGASAGPPRPAAPAGHPAHLRGIYHGTPGRPSYGAPSTEDAPPAAPVPTYDPATATAGGSGALGDPAEAGSAAGSAAVTGGAPASSAAVSRVGRPTGRLLARAGLAAVGLAVALGLGELAARALGLGQPPLRNPMLIVPGDERRVPLSEVALFRPTGPAAPGEGPTTRWRPYVFLKGWYDRPRWDYFDDSDCVDYVFNRYGLRDHDFELEKQPGEYRVVAIGDSFTFGIGVQLEDCWTERLEQRLREERGGPVQVVNAGFTSGHHPTIYRPWIVEDGVALQPDVLVVGLCLNDMHPDVSLYAYETERRRPPLGGRSRLLNAAQVALAGGPAAPPQPLPFLDIVLSDPDLWNSTQDALRHCNAVLRAAGIRFVVVPFPMLSGLSEREYPYARLLDLVSAFCEREGIEHVDLLPRFLGREDEELWVHPTDQHPNDRGHALIAEGLAEYLARP
jgi:lysophospholipase L1-like esterase